jgi:ribulose-5-phosphate 4-epimerase/fuculose-1-phosphate aldolase
METATARAELPRLADVAFHGVPGTPLLRAFARKLEKRMRAAGHRYVPVREAPGLVLNFVDAARPRPFRRRSQGTFVVSVVEVPGRPRDLLPAAYPYLVKTLSNLIIYITQTEDGPQTHFVTLEQGYYTAVARSGDAYFEEVYQRLAPLASTRLVINNIFRPDLPESLRAGDQVTEAIYRAGKRLEAMDLLPAPFPIDQLLGERDLAHVKRLFGIGGLSYGNVSARRDADSFWMSARGVNKANLREVGREVLLIADYEPREDAMVVRVPRGVEPRGASVDAIEHWVLYREHPTIGAIVHVHAWMEEVSSTTMNYPCGTYELAQEVAECVRRAPDPSRAVVGLKNHGLTITGRSLDEIFERIDGKILRQVPMS